MERTMERTVGRTVVKTPNDEYQAEQQRRRVQKVSKIEYIIVGVCVFAVLMFIVFNYVTVTQLTQMNATLKNEIAELASSEKALQAKQEQAFNLTDIEQKAREELGMIKLDKSQMMYIETTNPDVVSISDKNGELPEIVKSAVKNFNIIKEFLN